MRTDDGVTHRRASGGEHNGHNQQGTKDQQQPVPKLEALLLVSRCVLEIANGRKNDLGRLMTLHEVEQQWQCGGNEPEERPRQREGDHPLSARPSAVPKGRSVGISA